MPTEKVKDDFYELNGFNGGYIQEYNYSKCLENVIMSMKKLESATIDLKNLKKLAYGEDKTIIESYFKDNNIELTNDVINSEYPISYVINLYFFTEGSNNFTIDFDAKVKHINRKKDKAAQFINIGKYKRALKLLKIIDELSNYGVFDEDKQQLKPHRISALLNISLCYWKTENWVEMKKIALQVCELGPLNAKAYYRAVLADFKMLEYKKALDTLKQYKGPESAELKEIEGKIRAKIKEVNVKEKQMFKNMFN